MPKIYRFRLSKPSMSWPSVCDRWMDFRWQSHRFWANHLCSGIVNWIPLFRLPDSHTKMIPSVSMHIRSMSASFNSVISRELEYLTNRSFPIKISLSIWWLENSGKWPNDLSAIRRVKAAFHLQIAKALRKNFNLKAKGNADSVDVIKGESHGRTNMNNKSIRIINSILASTDYFFYRFTIAVPREVALLKKEVSQKGVTKYRDTIESLLLERETVLLPRLTVSLHR